MGNRINISSSGAIHNVALSDIGRKRTHNEDNYILVETLPGPSGSTLIGAIDGVGGYAGGAEAAAIAKKKIESYVAKGYTPANNEEELLLNALVHANNSIVQQRRQKEDLSRMSCVLSFAILNKEKETLHYAHVGDSRGYIFRKNELIKFTHDHSYVGYLEEQGTISEADAMNHPRRNEIFKMLGEKILDENNASEYVEIGMHSFYPNDIVLFCSDGLSDMVDSHTISVILASNQTLQEKCTILIEKANENGGKDNITVTLSQSTKKINNNLATKTYPVIVVEKSAVKTAKRPLMRLLFLLAGLLFSFVAGFLMNTKGTNYWWKKLSGSDTLIKTDIKNQQVKKLGAQSGFNQKDSTGTLFRKPVLNDSQKEENQ